MKKQKIVLVTGASSGIGKKMATYMAEQGYYVYAAARSMEKLQTMKSRNIEPLHLDVTDINSINNAVKQIEKTKGGLDILINNAGYGIYGTIEGVSQEQIQKAFDVNVFGLGQMTKAVLPLMREQQSGLIINVSSYVGKVSVPILGWYSATKHAVEGMTDALRMEVKPFGIKVALIEPGLVATGFEEVAMATLKKSNDPDVYHPMRDAFAKYVRNEYKKAPGPEVVIKELKKVLKTNNPRARYLAGKDSRLFIKMKGLLSDKMFDKIILGYYK
jgi:short-subunit dehydrogenase